ncbi:MAG: hypothetical protein LBN09_02490 [Clostridioides sp.]|jgi:NADH:ubiquinone oxidoreductase subunit 3 (subunit A)|nr:hypothetical protein [Clostridioides sp.]
MLNLMNVFCLLCIGFLVGDVMVYLCKDALKICEERSVKKKSYSTGSRTSRNIGEQVNVDYYINSVAK